MLEKKEWNFRILKCQRGAVTLTVGMIILLVATLMTLFAARVGILEQSISGNEFKSKRAFEAAHAGLDFAHKYLERNVTNLLDSSHGDYLWTECDPANSVLPPWDDDKLDPLCPTGMGWVEVALLTGGNTNPTDITLDYQAFILTPGTTTGGVFQTAATDPATMQATIVSEGFSDIPTGGTFIDGTGFAAINVLLTGAIGFSGDAARAPLIAQGDIGGGGSFTVVTNPNGGGKDIPLSAWSDGDTQFTAAVNTCQPHEYFDNATNGGTAYIFNPANPSDQSDVYTYGEDLNNENYVLCEVCDCAADPVESITVSSPSNPNEGIDIADSDGGYGDSGSDAAFPPNIFEAFFGVGPSQWETVKGWADQVLPDCSTLDDTSTGFIWVTGEDANGNPGVTDCNLTGNTDIARPDSPILLVVQSPTIRISGGHNFFGVLFATTADPATASTSDTTTVNLVGNNRFYGSFVADHTLDFGAGSYHAIYSDAVISKLDEIISDPFARVPGSWADYRN